MQQQRQINYSDVETFVNHKVPWKSSVRSFQRMRADVGPVVQDLLGDLLDVGIVVLRRVWNRLK